MADDATEPSYRHWGHGCKRRGLSSSEHRGSALVIRWPL